MLVVLRFTPTCVGKMPAGIAKAARSAVHPHVRGENPFSSRPRMVSSGSPPRAWGKSGLFRTHDGMVRFTPTCVGKIRSRSASRPAVPVHPHVRGENAGIVNVISGASRFTPTCVGKMLEYLGIQTKSYGSPPRAWGKCEVDLVAILHQRFTPTCVGKMSPLISIVIPSMVHPHVRGENFLMQPRVSLSSGSPPRAWGK